MVGSIPGQFSCRVIGCDEACTYHALYSYSGPQPPKAISKEDECPPQHKNIPISYLNRTEINLGMLVLCLNNKWMYYHRVKLVFCISHNVKITFKRFKLISTSVFVFIFHYMPVLAQRNAFPLVLKKKVNPCGEYNALESF